jgi:nicotinamide phosphoribosyltransferase
MNPILNTDSYKFSHYRQYPPETAAISAYIEARKGGKYDQVLFYGLQIFLKDYLTRTVTTDDIAEAEEMVTAHGLPFNREGWQRIVDRHGGLLPVEIEALPEGLVVPAATPLVQIRNTDRELFWLPTYIETALLRAVWYPTTVATSSWHVKQLMAKAVEKSCDDPAAVLPFRLHDFGARGTGAAEQAGIGGSAHLVNFLGTDTVAGLVYARRFYGEPMAGFSIPAAEHSTMTAWGEARETDAFRNMIEQFGGEGKIVAVVSDSYDLFNAADNVWGDTLKAEVEAMGGTVVVRPDSGDPTVIPIETIERLAAKFGHEINRKGYKLLPSCVRVIQGDGVTPKTIKIILDKLLAKGWSAENLAFGMGAGLLQKLDRDTLRFAMKANARQGTDGQWNGVNKDPRTDPGKASKFGRQAVIRKADAIVSVELDKLGKHDNLLKPVWRDGALLVDHSFAEIRARSEA